MKCSLLIVLLLVSVWLHAQSAKTNFEIRGMVEGDYRGKIFLSYYDSNGDLNAQPTNIVDDQFSFKGFLEEPVRARLSLDNPSNIGWFYLDTGLIRIKLKAVTRSANEISIQSVKGSVSDSLFNVFEFFWKRVVLSKEDDDTINRAVYQELKQFATIHPDHHLSVIFLNQSLSMLNYDQARNIFDLLSPGQQKKSVQYELPARIEAIQKTRMGSFYPFIPQSDSAGRIITGKELSYKYLLIEFWASWNGASRDENADLVSLYHQYHEKGFEILGISLDKNRASWIRAIATDQLPWIQVSDGKEFDNALAKYYAVSSIPFNLLLDGNGRIIGKDLKSELLKKKLSAFFHD